MYSVVLMMALSNGAGAPTYDVAIDGQATHSTGHYAYRGGRGGCCGCNGGGHRGGRHHGGHGCCGYQQCGCCGYQQCGCCGYQQQCGCYGYDGGHGAPSHAAPAPKKAARAEEEGVGEATQLTTAPAVVVVSLPEDAVLRVDDQPTTSTSDTRRLVTPELSSTGEFHYTLSAEIIRDGQKLTTTKQVAVTGGQETQVSLEFPAAVVAQR
jgi:uncharacterized protein (TIGR03000 family)